MCPSEDKIYKKLESQLKYPLSIIQTGPSVTLKVVDAVDHKNILYKSNPMYRKNVKHFYETNEEFHQWFDYAVDLSCHHRIINGLFKCQTIEEVCETEETTDNLVEEYIPSTNLDQMDDMEEPMDLI